MGIGESESIMVLLDIILYIAVGLGVSLLAKQYGFTPILGYMASGLLLGPFCFNLIPLEAWTHTAAEYGVVFLLFTLGLGVTWDKLWKMRYYVLVVGLLQVVLCSFGLAFALYCVGSSWDTAALIGAAFSFSSTAVVGQIAGDRNEFTTRFGRVILAILLCQDISVLFVLVWLKFMCGPCEANAIILGFRALFKAAVMLCGCAVLWKFVLRPVYRWVSMTRSSDLFVGMMLMMVLLLSFLTEMAGLSAELGAFLAGMLLGDTDYRSQVEVDIKPFKHLLLGLFFITIGMSVNTDVLMGKIGLILSMLFVFLAVKMSVVALTVRLFGRRSFATSMRVALYMCGGSEFGILLVRRAQESHLFTQQLSDVLTLVLIISLVLTPFLMQGGRIIAEKLKGVKFDPVDDEEDVHDHVIVVGLGHVGSVVLRALEIQKVPYYAIDNNEKRVETLGESREGVVLGNALHLEMLTKLSISTAKVVVVCMDNFRDSERVLSMCHNNFPDVKMIVRVHSFSQAAVAKRYGAVSVMPDRDVVAMDVFQEVLHQMGVSGELVKQSMKEIYPTIREEMNAYRR